MFERQLEKHDALSRSAKELQERLDVFATDGRELALALQEWETYREPEPARIEAVQKNRERLQMLGVEYHEFYKLIDFQPSLSEAERDQLEEALLEMGILDAPM